MESAGPKPGTSLAEVAVVMALAADLACGQPFEHVLRSCGIATRFARHLGVPEEERVATYWFTLFMLPGCTALSFELSRIFGDDIALRAAAYEPGPSIVAQLRYVLSKAGEGATWARRARIRAELVAARMRPLEYSMVAHCSINARLADGLGLGERVASALRQSFARWDGRGVPGLRGEEIALPVRIGALADMMEVFHRESGVEGAIAAARMWEGIAFDPMLVDVWCEVASDVLDAVDAEAAWSSVMADEANRSLGPDEVEKALELIADYADLKSPWFSGHSRGVAALTEAAALQLGLPASEVTSARHAALLHAIGRAGVPNSIWDKPGPLNDDEWERVRLHAYFTDRILRRAGGLARLAPIASSVHERVGGGGYPRGISGETIPLIGRILGSADRYHAMLEARPHRAALPPADAAKELRRMVAEGELDPAATDAVLSAAGHPVHRRPGGPAGLTPREVEVLELAARGATTRQIASRLGIKPKTAGNHIERIYAKIGVQSRAEAALFAMQHGLLRSLEP